MLSHRIARSTATRQLALTATRRLAPLIQQQQQQRRTYLPDSITGHGTMDKRYPPPPQLTEAEDPLQNGGYVQPPPVKRQFRDPYGDWWDKQERRNYGEPVHEDYDQLGMFSTYEYTWTTTGPGLMQIGAFIATVLGVAYIVKLTYPDSIATPREFEGGLEKELGGAGAVRAWTADDTQAAIDEA